MSYKRRVLAFGELKHTSLYLDEELLAEAEQTLGTKGATATVRAALVDVVRRRKLRELADWDLADLTPERLAELRAPRFS
jgi:Arc/MetJ family transcription regulator